VGAGELARECRMGVLPSQLAESIHSVLNGASILREAKAHRIAEAIRASRNYRWVGLYDVGEKEIAAIAWTGTEAPVYPQFPVGKGLCGAAVASGVAVVVNDVSRDPRYLTTFGSTKSEMIVPVKADASIVGLIDVESEKLNAFGDGDQQLLENCAQALISLWK
jgi:L-methionine (R)-S-oxide reductase